MIIKKIVAILLLVNSIYSASLNFNISKPDSYLNEPIIATLTLNYKTNENITDIKPIEFKAKDIVAKVVSTTKVKSSETTLVTYNLQLFPKKTGTIFIPKQYLKIATFDKKLQQTSWQKIYSSESAIVVKNIPNSLSISGNLNIKATLDKKSYKSKEPIALTITIYGLGATDSIKPFKLNLQNQTIFTENPIIKEKIINNKINNSFTQKFIIVAESNFTIPKIEFKYFNIDTQMVEYLSTKLIKVKILNTKKDTNIDSKLIYTLLGFILGIITSLAILKFLNLKKIKNPELKKRIKSTKTNKELYTTLLPYSNKFNLNNLIKKLEENIDNNKNLKLNKKEAIEIVIKS